MRICKTISTLALGAVLAASLTPGLAPKAADAHPGMRSAEWPAFEAIDADGDGRITREEFDSFLTAGRTAQRAERARHHEARHAARLDSLVAHLMLGAAEGVLDEPGLRAGLESWIARQRADAAARRAGRAGADPAADPAAEMPRQGIRGGGWRNRMDDAAQAEGHERGRARTGATHRDRLFSRIDSDGDGVISAEEYAFAVARMAERSERGRHRAPPRPAR